MKRLPLLLLILAILLPLHASKKKMIRKYNRLTNQWNSFPSATIHDIQFVPLDSLLKADTLQNSNTSRWTLQTSSFVRDTVVVTALVITPCASVHCGLGGLTFT